MEWRQLVLQGEEMGGNSYKGYALLILAIATVVAAYWVVVHISWVLALSLLGFCGFVCGSLGLMLLEDIERSDAYIRSEHPQGLEAIRLAVVNPIRARLGKPPIWLVPDVYYDLDDLELLKRANQLLVETQEALKQSAMSPAKKSLIDGQVHQILANMTGALWELARLRRISQAMGRNLGGSQNYQDVTQMQSQLRAAMRRSLQTLSALPVSLMKVELTRGDIGADRLSANLVETNAQLKDLSEGYYEISALKANHHLPSGIGR
jgi:hypothetical protein